MATESAAVEHRYEIIDGPGLMDIIYSLSRKNEVTFTAEELFGSHFRQCWAVIIGSIDNGICHQEKKDVYGITGIITQEGPSFTSLRRFKVPRVFNAIYDIRKRTGTLQITAPLEE